MGEKKPCPFCGSTFAKCGHVRDGYKVYCLRCGASAAPAYYGPNSDADERAIANWNMRIMGPAGE